MWVIFTVAIQTIRRAIRPHVLDVLMSVIFSVIVPGNVNGTKQRYPRVRRADREILTSVMKMLMLQSRGQYFTTELYFIRYAIQHGGLQQRALNNHTEDR